MIITKESRVEDVLRAYPKLARVFIQEGIPCLVCGESFWGTIEELALQYGKDTSTIVTILKDNTQSQE